MGDKQNSSEPLLAAIDLGSNSFHLMIAKSEFGELRPVHALAEKVQLGETSGAATLTSGAISRGLTCLERFKQLIDSTTPVKIRVVGTNALRRAKNRQAFIDPAEQIMDAPIDVIYATLTYCLNRFNYSFVVVSARQELSPIFLPFCKHL